MATSKLNHARYNSFLWLIIGIGFLSMHFIFKVVKIFSILGVVAILISMFMYSRVGHFSAKARWITCPACGKETQVIARVDACGHCKTQLIDEGKGVYQAYQRVSKTR